MNQLVRSWLGVSRGAGAYFGLLVAAFLNLWGFSNGACAADLALSASKLSVTVKGTASVTVSNAVGSVFVASSNKSVATAAYASKVVTVTGVAVGNAVVSVRDASQTRTIEVTVTQAVASGGNGSTTPSGTTDSFAVLAANDLGMHCADQDYQIFSILPPFNVIHAQVIKKGAKPVIVDNNTVDVFYSGASSLVDPAGAGSINTFSVGSTYKSNFWEIAGTRQSYGTQTYRRLYPSVSPLTSALDSFAPLPDNVGLPVPDPNKFPSLVIAQQAMPATGPQKFDRFDPNLAFLRTSRSAPPSPAPSGSRPTASPSCRGTTRACRIRIRCCASALSSRGRRRPARPWPRWMSWFQWPPKPIASFAMRPPPISDPVGQRTSPRPPSTRPACRGRSSRWEALPAPRNCRTRPRSTSCACTMPSTERSTSPVPRAPRSPA